jgi:hypothetical protein
MEEKKIIIPKMEDLVKDYDSWSELDEFTFLINQNPPEKWVREHPVIKNWKYLPIEKVEYLLKKIFKDYQIEIKFAQTAFNGVVVGVTVHYLHPVLNQWRKQDGIGAMQLQTAKGTSPADLANINNGAVSIAYPIAEVYAIKDACEKIGRIFGGDLNRKDTMGYEVFLQPKKNNKMALPDKTAEMIQDILKIQTIEELDMMAVLDWTAYPDEVHQAYTNRREQLK